jgi:hypothetical protein
VKVWRYMSFGRFVWLLRRKALWMSRLDQLGDAWEGLIGAGGFPVEGRIFVNSWTAQDSESHAMWSIYCDSKEGVAVQTTLARLQKSINFPVLPVKYVTPMPFLDVDVTVTELAVRKRKAFQYEKEHRIVSVPSSETKRPTWIVASDKEPDEGPHDGPRIVVTDVYGFPLRWDPEEWLEAVLIHPGADQAFWTSVHAVVDAFAPRLRNRIHLSGMAERPPIKRP